MRVLGVDPGLTRCGVGIVDGSPGRPCRLVGVEVLTTGSDEEFPQRLLHLDRCLTGLIAEHRPDSVAVERVFSQHNVRTVMGTAQAGKAQVTAMVTRLLKLPDRPRPADAADALALAICHVWRGGTSDRLAAAARAARNGGRG